MVHCEKDDYKILLQEVVPRGFLSNYTTILTSFRGYIQKEKIDPGNVFISSGMFSLYGNPKNWFESSKVYDNQDSGFTHKASTEHYDFEPWPTESQLNLLSYVRHFPYNERVTAYLSNNLKPIEDGFGIHFRGTDHSYHVNEVSLDVYFKSIDDNFDQEIYKAVFVCSDEEFVIGELKEYFRNRFNFTNVISNEVERSKTKTALHLTNYDVETKIKLGDEVLLDSHSLSACKTIIGKTSNLINYARILNPEIRVLYQDRGMDFRR